MIKHIKNLLEAKIKEITEFNVDVCQSDINIENFKDSDFVVSFEIHEGRKKSTNDFNIAIFINAYAKDPDNAIVIAKLVYDKLNKMKRNILRKQENALIFRIHKEIISTYVDVTLLTDDGSESDNEFNLHLKSESEFNLVLKLFNDLNKKE